jgi:AcrR family transcriptional regulator
MMGAEGNQQRRPDQNSLLPVLQDPPVALRADAELNRRKILAAAARLFDGRLLEDCSVDDVVAEAGVGKGTLYRIFGDKTGLAVALLDDRERALQCEVLSGDPPLGPGAAPMPRLRAFIGSYVGYVSAHRTLVQMSQTSRLNARFDTGAHRFWRTHLAYLLAEGGATDPELHADVLLAAMTAEQIGDWITRQRQPVERIAEMLTSMVERLISATGVEPTPTGGH